MMRAVWMAMALLVLGDAAAAAQPWLEKRIGVEMVTAGVDPRGAAVNGSGLRAWGGQLTLGVTAFRLLDARVELARMELRDEPLPAPDAAAADEQPVRITAGVSSIAIGMRTPRLALGAAVPAGVSLGAGVGHSAVEAHRGKFYCLDVCPDNEEVRFSGGHFWEAGLRLDVFRRHAVDARYRRYLGRSGFGGGVMVGWSLRL